jgi:hypothetical protein
VLAAVPLAEGDGSTTGASMAAMASSRTGGHGHVLELRGVGLSSDVGHLGGGPRRRISFPRHFTSDGTGPTSGGTGWSGRAALGLEPGVGCLVRKS